MNGAIPVFRYMYRAYLNEALVEDMYSAFVSARQCIRKLIDKGILMTATVSRYGREIYIYYESLEREMVPTGILGEIEKFLEPILHSLESPYLRLYDVYHTSSPQNKDHWKRNMVKNGRIRLCHLRPEMVSSYVFFHFQRQEEHGNDKALEGDRYGLIGMDGNLLAFYGESPCETEKSELNTLLNTQNTPFNEWDSIMATHFIPWEEGNTEYWMWIETHISEF